jgi:hypothetical protein
METHRAGYFRRRRPELQINTAQFLVGRTTPALLAASPRGELTGETQVPK